MTGAGHTLSGLTSGLLLGYLSFQCTNSVIASLATYAFCSLGSTAPDWMEITYSSRRLLKHRGITHTLSLWLLLFICSFLSLHGYNFNNLFANIPKIATCSLFGFFGGGVLHLLGDIPNKQKIPIITPFDGFSLNMWKSGKFEKTTSIILLFITSLFVYYQENIFTFTSALI